ELIHDGPIAEVIEHYTSDVDAEQVT
ncbi:MAG: hypothetical protein QOE64_1842, partial [Frankiales bacterium]|nr:hypothetical protein [Frankiales bacterium]